MCALTAILFIPPGLEIGEMGKNDDGHRVSITMPIVACIRAQQVGNPLLPVFISSWLRAA